MLSVSATESSTSTTQAQTTTKHEISNDFDDNYIVSYGDIISDSSDFMNDFVDNFDWNTIRKWVLIGNDIGSPIIDGLPSDINSILIVVLGVSFFALIIHTFSRSI